MSAHVSLVWEEYALIIEWFKNGTHIAALYAILNLISFGMSAIDKRKAIKNKWRISESALIISAVFGIIGGFCGMYIMHHKTRKPKFYIGLPIILILEIAAVCLIIYKF